MPFPISSYFLCCLGQLLCSELTVTCLATLSTTVQWVILQGIQHVWRADTQFRLSPPFTWTDRAREFLCFIAWHFSHPCRWRGAGRMPVRSFQSRWTEMDFGSYTALEEMEKPTSPRGGELSDWMTRRYPGNKLLCHCTWEAENVLLVPWVQMQSRPRRKRATLTKKLDVKQGSHLVSSNMVADTEVQRLC